MSVDLKMASFEAVDIVLGQYVINIVLVVLSSKRNFTSGQFIYFFGQAPQGCIAVFQFRGLMV